MYNSSGYVMACMVLQFCRRVMRPSSIIDDVFLAIRKCCEISVTKKGPWFSMVCPKKSHPMTYGSGGTLLFERPSPLFCAPIGCSSHSAYSTVLYQLRVFSTNCQRDEGRTVEVLTVLLPHCAAFPPLESPCCYLFITST
jgi:hypothetical protein